MDLAIAVILYYKKSTMGIDKEHKYCCLTFGMALSTIWAANHGGFHSSNSPLNFVPFFNNFLFFYYSYFTKTRYNHFCYRSNLTTYERSRDDVASGAKQNAGAFASDRTRD